MNLRSAQQFDAECVDVLRVVVGAKRIGCMAPKLALFVLVFCVVATPAGHQMSYESPVEPVEASTPASIHLAV